MDQKKRKEDEKLGRHVGQNAADCETFGFAYRRRRSTLRPLPAFYSRPLLLPTFGLTFFSSHRAGLTKYFIIFICRHFLLCSGATAAGLINAGRLIDFTEFLSARQLRAFLPGSLRRLRR